MEQEEALNNVVHSLLEERALVDDPDWDSFAVIASITPSVSDMTAFRYSDDRPGKPTPLRGTKFDQFRQLQAATLRPDGTAWEVAIIKIDRDSKRFVVNFVYSDEAELWRVQPDTAARIAENARPRHADFVT